MSFGVIFSYHWNKINDSTCMKFLPTFLLNMSSVKHTKKITFLPSHCLIPLNECKPLLGFILLLLWLKDGHFILYHMIHHGFFSEILFIFFITSVYCLTFHIQFGVINSHLFPLFQHYFNNSLWRIGNTSNSIAFSVTVSLEHLLKHFLVPTFI